MTAFWKRRPRRVNPPDTANVHSPEVAPIARNPFLRPARTNTPGDVPLPVRPTEDYNIVPDQRAASGFGAGFGVVPDPPLSAVSVDGCWGPLRTVTGLPQQFSTMSYAATATTFPFPFVGSSHPGTSFVLAHGADCECRRCMQDKAAKDIVKPSEEWATLVLDGKRRIQIKDEE
jgi:hypothetical protein